MNSMALASPRTGATAAPANDLMASSRVATRTVRSQSLPETDPANIDKRNSSRISWVSSLTAAESSASTKIGRLPKRSHPSGSPLAAQNELLSRGRNAKKPSVVIDPSFSKAKAQAEAALKENDAMVYLEGPNVYSCGQCRTHLTSHDEIISKSFHGRNGRAYLFESCVNVEIGKAEDRTLITGLHSVCDIYCKRCKTLVGWTYAKAYEPSQKYKEGKFIVEKINLHVERNSQYDIRAPAGHWPCHQWNETHQGSPMSSSSSWIPNGRIY